MTNFASSSTLQSSAARTFSPFTPTPERAHDTSTASDVHALPWRPYEPTWTAPIVLVVVDPRSMPGPPVQWATAAAKAIDGELHLVVALGDSADVGDQGASSLVARLRDVAPGRRLDVELCSGDVRGVALAAARSRAPALIVVGADFGRRATCALVDALGIPVLVAREPRRGGAILAASDMRDLNFPVVSVARRYAHALGRPLTLFHNAKTSPVPTPDLTWPTGKYTAMLGLHADVAAAKAIRLRHVADTAGVESSAVVARERNTVDAILALARNHDVDMVTVGHRRPPLLSRWLRGRLTERVLTRCKRSVLVVPVHSP